MRLAAAALLLLTPTANAADLLIDFAPGGPKVVRVEATLDGTPLGPLWEAAVGDLFQFFDHNRDGKLDKAECERLVAPTARRRPNVGEVPRNDFGFLGVLAFEGKAESVDRAAFAAALRAAGFSPVTVVTQAGRPENPALTVALFKHLDADGDGKLSASELRAARAALTPLDVNEDEWLSVPELLGRAVSGVQRNQPVARPTNGTAAPDWLVLQGDEAAAVKALLLRGGPKATTLTARDLAMADGAFKKLDANGDGKLDAAELTAWLRQPPDWTLTVALSGKLGRSRVTPHDTAMTPDGRQVTFTGDSGAATNARRRAALLDQFAKARSENASSFGVPDWPGQVPGRAFAAAYAKIAASSVTLEVTDRGRALFDWLDADGNGQLSPRELNAAAGRFPSVPISPSDVPRQVAYRAFCQGLPVPDPYGLVKEPRAPGPAWFVRMDRNRDGDVSLREFLGPLDLFRRLDADGDGLISAAESLKP